MARGSRSPIGVECQLGRGNRLPHGKHVVAVGDLGRAVGGERDAARRGSRTCGDGRSAAVRVDGYRGPGDRAGDMEGKFGGDGAVVGERAPGNGLPAHGNGGDLRGRRIDVDGHKGPIDRVDIGTRVPGSGGRRLALDFQDLHAIESASRRHGVTGPAVRERHVGIGRLYRRAGAGIGVVDQVCREIGSLQGKEQTHGDLRQRRVIGGLAHRGELRRRIGGSGDRVGAVDRRHPGVGRIVGIRAADVDDEGLAAAEAVRHGDRVGARGGRRGLEQEMPASGWLIMLIDSICGDSNGSLSSPDALGPTCVAARAWRTLSPEISLPKIV